MSREPFNWSSLTRDRLYKILNEAKKNIVGKKLYTGEIHDILKKQVKKHLPVRVKMSKDPVTESGYIYIGGGYYSDYDKRGWTRHTEIVFSYHLFDEYLKITPRRWDRMCSVFADTVLHELIHMRQYRTRKFKFLPDYESTALLASQRRDQKYYGDTDEIGAYSFNIACELYDRFGNNPRFIKQYMDSNYAKRHKRSTYFRYLKTFDFNHDHKIIKKLKKKVLYYIPYAELGKPFKTSDYLTY